MSGSRTVTVGDVYQVPLSLGDKAIGAAASGVSRRGWVGLCHVIAAEPPKGAWDSAGRWRVVLCAWFGPATDVEGALTRPESLAPLQTVQRGRGAIVSVPGSPPRELRLVGRVLPTRASRALRSSKRPFEWQWAPLQMAAELALRTAPELVTRLAEQGQARRRVAWQEPVRSGKDGHRRGGNRRVEPQPAVLARLARSASLAPMRGPGRGKLVAEAQEALRALARDLHERAPSSARSIASALRRATRQMNTLARRHSGAVTTPDAELLREILVRIARAAGLGDDAAERVVSAVQDF